MSLADFIASGALGRGDVELFRPIFDNLLDHDPFLLLADLPDLCRRPGPSERDPHAWTRRSILNTARRANSHPIVRSGITASLYGRSSRAYASSVSDKYEA
jgi:Carbohydrate phosphorylase